MTARSRQTGMVGPGFEKLELDLHLRPIADPFFYGCVIGKLYQNCPNPKRQKPQTVLRQILFGLNWLEFIGQELVISGDAEPWVCI